MALNEVKIGDYSVKLSVNEAILDTGSSFITVPSDDYDRIYKAIITDKTQTCTKNHEDMI